MRVQGSFLGTSQNEKRTGMQNCPEATIDSILKNLKKKFQTKKEKGFLFHVMYDMIFLPNAVCDNFRNHSSHVQDSMAAS